MGKKIQFVIWIIACLVILALIGSVVYATTMKIVKGNDHPVVTFELSDDYGTVKMELYPEYAPNTVTNFIKLVQVGFYNDKVIYGKDEICLYAGRDSTGEVQNPKLSLIDSSVEADSDNDYEYTIPGEFYTNEFLQNTLRHEKGIITLIRNDYTQYLPSLSEESYNSGNAQIGIMMSDKSNTLNGVYAAFGRVIEGMDNLEKMYNEAEIAPEETSDDASAENQDLIEEADMAEDETSDGSEEIVSEDSGESEEENEEEGGISKFANFPKIVSATVDTHGIDYGMPKVEKMFDYTSYMNDMMSQYYNY